MNIKYQDELKYLIQPIANTAILFYLSDYYHLCMRIRRKSNRCLNCESTLDNIYNFCPNCGQENNDNNISFGKLFSEFFTNYIALDTRIGRSFIPFFFKPGNLTNKFNEGFRVSFMHPIRMYLVVSLFYFFAFQLLSNTIIKEQEEKVAKISKQLKLDDIKGVSETTIQKLNNVFDQDLIEEINNNLDEKNLADVIELLDDKTRSKVINALDSAELTVLKKAGFDADSIKNPAKESFVLNFGGKSDSIYIEGDSVFTKKSSSSQQSISNWNIVEKYKDDRKITDRMLFDSLNNENSSDFEAHFWNQYIRVRRSDKRTLVNYIVDNLPIMMLFLLPIFALILKVFYRRNKILYIKHVVHALHLHSFAYIIYGITILLVVYVVKDDGTQNWVEFLSFVIVSTYTFISFLKVYKQRIFKTLIKFNMVGFIYSFCIFLFFAVELFLSFIFY